MMRGEHGEPVSLFQCPLPGGSGNSIEIEAHPVTRGNSPWLTWGPGVEYRIPRGSRYAPTPWWSRGQMLSYLLMITVEQQRQATGPRDLHDRLGYTELRAILDDMGGDITSSISFYGDVTPTGDGAV